MFKLVSKLILQSLSINLVIHLLIDAFINSFLVVIIGQYMMSSLLDNNLQLGIYLAISLKAIDIIDNSHGSHYLQKARRQFRRLIHVNLHRYLESKLLECNWNDIRKIIENNFDRAENKAKWSIINFASSLISQTICVFPLIGYSFWIGYHAPLSLTAIILSIIISVRYIDRSTNNIGDFYNAWEDYSVESDKKFYSSIHHHEQEYLQKSSDCIDLIEKLNIKSSANDELYINKIKSVLVLVMMTDLIIRSRYFINQLDSMFVILYIQYLNAIISNITNISQLYISYSESSKEYNTFICQFDNLKKRTIVDQICPAKSIIISDLNFSYEPNDSLQKPFGLQTVTDIDFKFGQIILLLGDISNGKSTFMDIIAGVIPWSKCRGSVQIDNVDVTNGFSAITNHRLYCEQEPRINWKPSVYEIISDTKPVFSSMFMDTKQVEINLETENNVWWALEQSCCADYFKRINDSTNKKWIYSQDVSPSPGLKACVRLAKIFYNTKVGSYRIVVGDELDRAISAKRVVTAMENLFNCCRSKSILLIISAHSSEVHQMKYDQVLKFTNGKIMVD